MLQSGCDGGSWTAIGLFGAALLGSFGGFFYIGTGIDALRARLDSGMDGLNDRLDAQGAIIQAQGPRPDRCNPSPGRELTAAIKAQGAELAAQTIAAGNHRRGTGHLVDASAIRAYAEGANRPASSWRRHLGDYLRLSVEHLDASDADQAKELAARQRLLRSIV